MVHDLRMPSDHMMYGDVMCRDGVNRRYPQVGEAAVALGQPGLELVLATEIAGTKCVLVSHRGENSRIWVRGALAERKRTAPNSTLGRASRGQLA
jgi:hypothetical protein